MRYSKRVERLKKRISGQVGDGDEIIRKLDPEKKLDKDLNVLSTGRTKKVTGKEPVSALVSHKQKIGRNRNLLDKIWKRINNSNKLSSRVNEEDLNEMASLLGPDSDPEEEKKILKQLKGLKFVSNKLDFEKELKKLLNKINTIRRYNKIDTIDRTELLSRTMKKDVDREVKEKKNIIKAKRKKEIDKMREKKEKILGSFVPIKMIDTRKLVYTIGGYKKEIYFRAEYFGKPFIIILTREDVNKNKFFYTIKSKYGKVVNIDKEKIIGEIRFPGGEKYEYGTKVVFTKNVNTKVIIAKVKRL